MADPPAVTVGCYWVNDYKKPPHCGSGHLKQTKYCDNLVDGFAGAMRWGGHRVAVSRVEGAASPRQWMLATDSDPDGVDTVDFAYLATHGGTHGQARENNVWVHWVNATFNSRDACLVSTVELGANGVPDINQAPKAAMRLGDGSLRWVVLDLCRSLQVRLDNEVFRQANETEEEAAERRFQLGEAHPAHTWTRCFGGVHIIFGFTGRSSDAGSTSTRGAAFGRRAAAGEPLAESWLDEAYSSGCDDAPVALAWGRSEEDAMRRLKAESLASPEPTLSPNEIGGAAIIWWT